MATYVGFLSDMWKDPPRLTRMAGRGRKGKIVVNVLLFRADSCNLLGKYVFFVLRELEMLAGEHFHVRAHPC